MGAGPLRLRREFAFAAEEVEPETEWRSEITTAFQLYRQLAMRVAARADRFPVVLAGNCGACIGTAAGVGMHDLGVIWFDAHGDFNTPETSTSGFLDGMALSILAGRCFTQLSASIPGYTPLLCERIVHAGGHDLDVAEPDAFAKLNVGRISPGEDPTTALERLAENCSRLAIHIDLDVLDVDHGRANHYASSGGMSPDEVSRIVSECADRFEVASISIASYDPSFDGDGRIATAAKQFVNAALQIQ